MKTVLVKFFQVRNEYSRVLDNNGRLWREGENLRYEINRLKEENKDLRHVNSELRKQNRDHALLRKVFGSEQIDQMILQAKQLAKMVALTKRYTRIDELTTDILNNFIDKIAVHERVKGPDGKKTQEIEIYYSYVGIVNVPTAEEIETLRKERRKQPA